MSGELQSDQPWATNDGLPYIYATLIKSNMINTAQMFEQFYL